MILENKLIFIDAWKLRNRMHKLIVKYHPRLFSSTGAYFSRHETDVRVLKLKDRFFPLSASSKFTACPYLRTWLARDFTFFLAVFFLTENDLSEENCTYTLCCDPIRRPNWRLLLHVILVLLCISLLPVLCSFSLLLLRYSLVHRKKRNTSSCKLQFLASFLPLALITEPERGLLFETLYESLRQTL